MNSHFTLKIYGFSIVGFFNGLLLRTTQDLEFVCYKRKLFRPELIRAPFN